jgi:hypothetical protein
MQISKAAIGLIVAAGITAGAGGAFFARPEPPNLIETTPLDHSGNRLEDGAITGGAINDRAGGDDAAVSAERVVRDGELPVAKPAAAERPRAVPAPRPPLTKAAPAPGVTIANPVPPAIAADERAAIASSDSIGLVEPEAPRPVEPPLPELIELVVSADSVIGLQLDSTITSDRARVEDPVEAHVVRDVRVGDRVAIPAGSKVTGVVTLVERGGRVKERARLGVRFTSVALPNGTRLPIQTETVYREGESQARSSSAKIGGGAIGGAILGGIFGGAKGAAIGGSAGAGAGTAAVMAGGRNQATLASGSPVTVRIDQPIVVTAEK